MERRKNNLIFWGTIIITLLSCLSIKWVVQQAVVVNSSIELSNLFWLNYLQHVCEYLDLNYGVEAVGRILIIVYITIAFLLRDRKVNKSMTFLSLLYISTILLVNFEMRATEVVNLISFISTLALLNICYVLGLVEKYLSKTVTVVCTALYIAASLGNIIEMNITGWVTDYLYFLPAYGFKASSNIEDWLIWITTYGFIGFLTIGIVKFVVKSFKVYRKGRKENEKAISKL